MPTITLTIDDDSYPQMVAAFVDHYAYPSEVPDPAADPAKDEVPMIPNPQSQDDFVVQQFVVFAQAHLDTYLVEQAVAAVVQQTPKVEIKQVSSTDLTAVDSTVFEKKPPVGLGGPVELKG